MSRILTPEDWRNRVEGFYPDLPDEDYFAATIQEGVASNSGVAPFGISFDHGLEALVNPPEKTSWSMDWGSAYHVLLFQPELFDSKVGIIPMCIGEGCGAKAKYLVGDDPFCGTHVKSAVKGGLFPKQDIPRDMALLTQEDHDNLFRARDVLMAHPKAPFLLEGDSHEGSMLSRDDDTGLIVRGRIDHFSSLFDDTFVDLKTASSAKRKDFRKSCVRFNYVTQAPLYQDLYARVGKPTKHFAFIVQESSPPFAVAIYHPDEEFMETGRREYKRRLALLKRAMEALESKTPAPLEGYSADIMTLSLSKWDQDAFDELHFN